MVRRSGPDVQHTRHLPQRIPSSIFGKRESHKFLLGKNAIMGASEIAEYMKSCGDIPSRVTTQHGSLRAQGVLPSDQAEWRNSKNHFTGLASAASNAL